MAVLFVNGKFCKDPRLVTADDFVFQGLNIPRPVNDPVGTTLTLINVDQLPGLNTLSVALTRIDFAPNGGENPPHLHPRASEIFLALEGTFLLDLSHRSQTINSSQKSSTRETYLSSHKD
ncbi:hypothetical protein Pint_18939 [Pistacia integerrima]|uniref:Uncharacterized protein n=1 Tax=Pistacia integerrima TaxID=434235 RepID=A0ACC0YVB2_9ROSI|nr:hypothetical protein Pint_18939 [Pistacia integerrima]